MSNATPSPFPERDNALYLRDMVDFCDTVVAYTKGFDLDGLIGDRMRYDATLRNIELIGVAAGNVPVSMREQARKSRGARSSARATAWRIPT
jgi:uncharacterized protein with HEPN domain